jgi:hypothetical protein
MVHPLRSFWDNLKFKAPFPFPEVRFNTSYLLSDIAESGAVQKWNAVRRSLPRFALLAVLLLSLAGVESFAMSLSQRHLDGRSEYRWFLSVSDYLNWRALRTQRDSADRYNPERVYYFGGIHALTECHNNLRDCACVYCQGAPFADERKPRVLAFARAAGKRAA